VGKITVLCSSERELQAGKKRAFLGFGGTLQQQNRCTSAGGGNTFTQATRRSVQATDASEQIAYLVELPAETSKNPKCEVKGRRSPSSTNNGRITIGAEE